MSNLFFHYLNLSQLPIQSVFPLTRSILVTTCVQSVFSLTLSQLLLHPSVVPLIHSIPVATCTQTVFPLTHSILFLLCTKPVIPLTHSLPVALHTQFVFPFIHYIPVPLRAQFVFPLTSSMPCVPYTSVSPLIHSMSVAPCPVCYYTSSHHPSYSFSLFLVVSTIILYFHNPSPYNLSRYFFLYMLFASLDVY